jgi:hypothetical protein
MKLNNSNSRLSPGFAQSATPDVNESFRDHSTPNIGQATRLLHGHHALQKNVTATLTPVSPGDNLTQPSSTVPPHKTGPVIQFNENLK